MNVPKWPQLNFFFHFSKAKTLLIKYYSHLFWESNLVEKIRHLPDIIKLSDNIFVKEILVSLAVWLIRKNINKGIGNKWAEENGKHPWIIKINYRFSQFLDLFFAGIWCFQHFGEWSAVIRKDVVFPINLYSAVRGLTGIVIWGRERR